MAMERVTRITHFAMREGEMIAPTSFFWFGH